MAEHSIIRWLKAERRKAFFLSSLYALAALGGGSIALALTFGLVSVAANILVLFAFPGAQHAAGWSHAIALLLIALMCADNVRSRRDDMSIAFLWLMRECLYIGPRAILDGWRSAARLNGLLRLDVPSCANVLSFLAARNTAASNEEVSSAFPGLVWPRLVAQLRLLEGVLLLGRNQTRVTLTTPLRLKLRRLLAEIPSEEPGPIVVPEPENLSPHEILGVSSVASFDEVKAAYRKRVKECHPDRFAREDEHSRWLAEEWTKSLNAAYQSLAARQKPRR